MSDQILEADIALNALAVERIRTSGSNQRFIRSAII